MTDPASTPQAGRGEAMEGRPLKEVLTAFLAVVRGRVLEGPVRPMLEASG